MKQGDNSFGIGRKAGDDLPIEHEAPSHPRTDPYIPYIASDATTHDKISAPFASPAAETFFRSIARKLQMWGADEPLVAAGLLHELVYNNALSVEQVRTVHGDHAAFLCDAYCQITRTTPSAS